jgi:hypothetical protein
MNQKPLVPNRPYLIKQTTQVAQARIRKIRHRIDIHTLAHQPADELELNGIAVVSVEAQRPLFFDPYRTNRATGSFILIDPITNESLGAGMILEPHTANGAGGRVTEAERQAARGHAPLAICLRGGSPEVAWALERILFDHGCAVHVIEKPLNLHEALRTALAAGLIAIVAASDHDADIMLKNVPLHLLEAMDLPQGSPEDSARQVYFDLEKLGRLGNSPDPLTGGAGI